MSMTCLGSPNARADAIEVSNDEAEPWLVELDVDKTLCIPIDSTELVRFCNESDDCH
jgi:hypothetical protein